jgi:hypothetical protein
MCEYFSGGIGWNARTCLMATISPVLRSTALYTFPKLPPVSLSVVVLYFMMVDRTAQLLHHLVVFRHCVGVALSWYVMLNVLRWLQMPG